MIGYDDSKDDDAYTLLGARRPRNRKHLAAALLLAGGAVALLSGGVLTAYDKGSSFLALDPTPSSPPAHALKFKVDDNSKAEENAKLRLEASSRPVPAAQTPPTALLVVGTTPDQLLFADLPFQQRLEAHGYTVTLIQDKHVTGAHCETHDIMVVSGSVGGGNIKTRLNSCATPQIIYEVLHQPPTLPPHPLPSLPPTPSPARLASASTPPPSPPPLHRSASTSSTT